MLGVGIRRSGVELPYANVVGGESGRVGEGTTMIGRPGSVADGDGSSADRDAAVPLTLETGIDLEGNARPGRLVADGQSLILSNGRPESQRQWPLAEIDGFRVQPAIGSCFIQAHVAGGWTDLLRRPGTADRQLTELIDRLNAQSRHGGRAEDSGRPADVRQPILPAGRIAGQPASAADAPPRRMAAELFSLLRLFYGSVLLLLGLSAAAVGIEVVPPLLQGMLVDCVLKADVAENPPEQLLLLLSAIVTGLLLVRLLALPWWGSAGVLIWEFTSKRRGSPSCLTSARPFFAGSTSVSDYRGIKRSRAYHEMPRNPLIYHEKSPNFVRGCSGLQSFADLA